MKVLQAPPSELDRARVSEKEGERERERALIRRSHGLSASPGSTPEPGQGYVGLGLDGQPKLPVHIPFTQVTGERATQLRQYQSTEWHHQSF